MPVRQKGTINRLEPELGIGQRIVPIAGNRMQHGTGRIGHCCQMARIGPPGGIFKSDRLGPERLVGR